MSKNFLIINCTGKNDSIALLKENSFFIKDLQTNKVKYELLNLEILDLLKNKKTVLDSNFSILVNTGPGSFSGIRIALAVAKGIHLTNKINIFAYNNFLLNAVTCLQKNQKVISIQKTNNFFYSIQIDLKNKTSSSPILVDFKKLQNENDIIVVSKEEKMEKNFTTLDKLKVHFGEINLKNLSFLIDNNLLEKKLIRPIYLS